jgi:DNA-binding transcriptional ArsR family regulator
VVKRELDAVFSALADPTRRAIVDRLAHTDIRAWIATWNDDPKPFVWTKTADQILESISPPLQPN